MKATSLRYKMDVNKKLMDVNKKLKKSRKYRKSYLNYGFTFILQNDEEKNLSVLFAARY